MMYRTVLNPGRCKVLVPPPSETGVHRIQLAIAKHAQPDKETTGRSPMHRCFVPLSI